jgi:hypothetical protein
MRIAGSASGKDVDKFAYAGLGHFPTKLIGAPLVEAAAHSGTASGVRNQALKSASSTTR